MTPFGFYTIYRLITDLASHSSSKGIDLHNGCPNAMALPSFNVTQSLGLWYYAYTTERYQGQRCIHTFRNANKYEDKKYLYAAVNSNARFNSSSLMRGQVDPSQPATYHFTIKENRTPVVDYMVLGFDYANYIVIYWCYTVGNKSIIDASILTRTRMSEDHLDEALEIAAKNGIKREDLHHISAEICPLE